MKKRFIFVVCFIMILISASMTVSAFTAYDVKIEVSEKRACVGDTIVVTVNMPLRTMAKSLTITPIYDDTVLECSAGTWLVDGSVTEFKQNGEAVLEMSDTMAFNGFYGDVFVYTFTVKENPEKYGLTRISCKLAIDTGSEIVEIESEKEKKVNIVCEHDYGEWTCAEDYQETICSLCGRVKQSRHRWDEGTVIKESTCAENGEMFHKCTQCDATKTELMKKTTVHTYGECEYDTENYHKLTCTLCGKYKTITHTWAESVVTEESTCAEKGTKTYTCTECNGTKTKPIKKTTVHTYGEYEYDTEDYHKSTCTVCGKYKTVKHTWDEGVVTKESTCAEEGVMTYTCTECNGTKTKSIRKKSAHTYGACEDYTDGYHKSICTVCGKYKTIKHTWDEGVITKESTCAEEGVMTYTCTICNGTKEKSVEKTTVHTYGEWEDYTKHYHNHTCTVCGGTAKARHTWNEGVITKEATCAENGVMTYTCTTCHGTKEESIKKTTVHTYGEYEKDTDIYHKSKCTVCGKYKTVKHTWEEDVCTECGEEK